jgi:hypothetical protein
MAEDEKDKYEELERLDDVEAEIEELPVESVPEPFSEVTQPMDDLQQQAAAKADEGEPHAAPEESGTDLGKKIEEAAKVRDASEYLRGQKQVKVIKKSAIKGIVDGIIKSYSGMEHQELLSKIAEYEFNISNLRQEKDALGAELEELKKSLQQQVEDTAIRYEKEVEELRMRLAAAEEMLAQDTSKEKMAKLEEEVIYLRQRVQELERGLEFAATIEEYDYGVAIESAMEQRQKALEVGEMIDRTLASQPDNRELKDLKDVLQAMGGRYEYLMELLKEASHSYSDLFKKVQENEGSVPVVAELVRLNARNRGWTRDLEVCGRFLSAAESRARSN